MVDAVPVSITTVCCLKAVLVRKIKIRWGECHCPYSISPVAIPREKLVLKQPSTTERHYNHNFIIAMYQVSVCKQSHNLKGCHTELLSDTSLLCRTLKAVLIHYQYSHNQRWVALLLKVTFLKVTCYIASLQPYEDDVHQNILLTPSEKAARLLKSMQTICADCCHWWSKTILHCIFNIIPIINFMIPEQLICSHPLR